MRKTVILKKPQATPEEDVAYLLDKMDYMLRKVESYDRALNEFNVIKETIEEGAENSRNSKNMVKNAFDYINNHADDISSLSFSCADLSEKIEEKFNFFNDRMNVLFIKSNKDREDLESKINELREQIQKELSFYLTLDDLREIKAHREKQDQELINLHSIINDNRICVFEELESLKSFHKDCKEKILLLQKDLCRLQNALVRKGVPVDNQ